MRAALLLILVAHTAAAAPELTCKDIEADHQAAEKSKAFAYSKALAAQSLTPVTLETARVPDVEAEADVDKKIFGATVTPWKPFAFKRQTVIVDEIYRISYGRRTDVEFVKDAKGDIWRVRRQPSVRTIKSVSVKACAWGCWGNPGGGRNPGIRYARDVWIVPAGQTYRGDVNVAYSAPSIDVTIIDQRCAPPP